MLRKFIIKMLFYTLSVEKKLEIGVYVNEKIEALASVIHILTGKKKRRSHKRGPYKTKNKLPEVVNTAEEVTLKSPFGYPPLWKQETTSTEEHTHHDYPKGRRYRGFYVDQLKHLGYGEGKYITGELSTVSAGVHNAKEKLGRNFKCSQCGPHTVEVTRTR